MSVEAWLIFAGFWVLFVTTPGPNAVNCIQNGMSLGFVRALPGVAGILCQASLFLTLSALGVAALLVASPGLFFWAKLVGAAFLVWLGIRGWLTATRPVEAAARAPGRVFRDAFLIATINAKSVAGYLAAFTQFVQPDVPIGQQMWVIVPTALTLTTLSYCTYTALGAGLGRLALGAVMDVTVRRAMALCFVGYGVALGTSALPGRAA
jgi:homoserine/homoserine lactone efflux protein